MDWQDPFVGQYRDGFVQANGVRLHYTEWNPEGSLPVLMVHGANVQLHTWDPIAAELARDHRVVCVDLRGHGDSDWTRDGYWVRNFVADLHSFVNELKLVPFDYIGHSLGARVGIGYAGEHTATVRHLVLSDTGPETPREGAMLARSVVGSGTGEVRGFRSQEEALEHFRQQHPSWQEVFLRLHVLYQLRENWAGKLVFKADPDLFWMTGSAGLKENPYLWDMTARISVPTLIMWGKRSGFFNQEIIGKMLANMPKAELVRPDTNHYIPREAPDEFLRMVREFLAR